MDDIVGGCLPDFDASLAAAASAYRSLAAENQRLRQELAEARMPRNVRQVKAHAPAKPQLDMPDDAVDMEPATSGGAAPRKLGSSPMMESVFRSDEVQLMNKQRNASCADLQQLIADFDPEERGAWATQELQPEACLELLRGHTACTKAQMDDILEKLRSHLLQMSPPVDALTAVNLVNITDLELMNEVFGEAHVPVVLALQDSLTTQMTNELVTQWRRPSESSSGIKGVCSFEALRQVVESLRDAPKFDLVDGLGSFFVVCNTIILGISMDVSPGWVGWDFVSAAFALLFVVELITKIIISGGLKAYFSCEHRWRVFDMLIILLASLDIAVLPFVEGGKPVDTSFVTIVRIIRLMRLTRISRLCQTSVFNELAYMIRGIEAGTSTLAWALVLLAIVCYIGAVLLMQTIGRESSAFWLPYRERHFDSVTLSMFTLFRCFTGDCSAYNGLPLSYVLYEQFGPVSIAVYWSCVMLVTFGLFNVMVANFLQNSQRAARFNDVERRRIFRRERKMVHEKTASLLSHVQELYRKSAPEASTSDMRITREMFRQMLRDKELMQWLEDMGCDDGLREKLFDKIDRDANGVLSANELVEGLVDLLRGRFDNMENVTAMLRTINARLVDVEGALTVTRGPVNFSASAGESRSGADTPMPMTPRPGPRPCSLRRL